MSDEVLCQGQKMGDIYAALRHRLGEVDEHWRPERLPSIEEFSEVMDRVQSTLEPGQFLAWNDQDQYCVRTFGSQTQ